MTYRTIQRNSHRRNRRIGWGCLAAMMGGFVICGLSLLVLITLLPRIGLQLAGFEQTGSTDAVFTSTVPIPTIQIQNVVPAPAQVFVDAGQYGTFNVDASQMNITLGDNGTGAPIATTVFTESQLLTLCRQRTVICGTGDDRIRNATIDLRPGGGVIYGEFAIGGLWQSAGVVLKLDSARAQFELIGVDMGGTLYSVPPGNIGESVDRVIQTGNDLLRQITVEAAGTVLDLSEIYADDTSLILVLR